MRNGKNALTVLANSVSIDIAASYVQLCCSTKKYHVKRAPHHICFLEQKVCMGSSSIYVRVCSFQKRLCMHVCQARGGAQELFSRREIGDLRMNGVSVDDGLSLSNFNVASIMGVKFHAGQWRGSAGQICSSVFTCVLNGRSVYGYVRKFFSVDGDECPGYASVTWFGEPAYPLGSNKLEVVVSGDGSRLDSEAGCIIRITTIDPSCVVIEPSGTFYRMMRQSGYDTTL